jgi:YVTN family beta-propeller protein
VRGAIASVAVLFFLVAAIASPPEDGTRYLSPGEMVFSVDGRSLYVVCEKSNEVRVVDLRTQTVAHRIPVGRDPQGLSLSTDGTQLFVANSWDDTVSIIDTKTLEVSRTVVTGAEPISVVPDLKNQTLFVANRLSNDISVIDLASGREIKRLAAGRGASYLTLSPDGQQILCTHIYPKIGEFRKPPQSEITVIDVAKQRVVERKPLHNAAGIFHVALASDASFGVAAQLRPKNLIPLAHVEHGWAFGDSLSLFSEDFDGVIQVPLDELERYYAMPFGVAVSRDNAKIFVTAGGSNMVSVIDAARLLKFARLRHDTFANDLSAPANYVSARIPVGRNPRGLALSPDGKRLYVSNRMEDTVSVIDTTTDRVIGQIDLGGPKAVTPLRRGEQIFYASKYSFQGQFSCANCHIDTTFDGLQWDLEPDGFGVDIVDNRSIEDLIGTEPFKWNGGNPDMPTECGARTEKYFYRSQSYTQEELTDLVTFVYSLPYRPNRYRLPHDELTPAQERGKAIFERTQSKDGRAIPERNQCAYCHSGPKYTNRQQMDVGTGKLTDRSALIDVPQLPNVVNSAPYLHDGSARTLEEIWTLFNPKDQHGVTNDLTKDELNDLIEYLRTL